MIKEKWKTWDKVSAKIGDIFNNLPFSPNFYSCMTLPPALFGMIAIIEGWIGTGVLLFSIAGLLDLVDGAIARKRGLVSKAGAFLDGSIDRFVDFFLLYSYFWVSLNMPWLSVGQWIAIAMFVVIMPSFEVAYANHRQAVDDPDEKIIWRIFNRGEMYILMLLIPLMSMVSATFAGYLFMILIFFSLVTTLQTFFETLTITDRWAK